jgi:hypothetical protein
LDLKTHLSVVPELFVIADLGIRLFVGFEDGFLIGHRLSPDENGGI